MGQWLNQLVVLAGLIKQNLPTAIAIIAIIWGCYFLNYLLGGRLNILGIYPRSIVGLPGIFFHPFLHADFNHLFFNSIPLFVLVNFLLVQGLGPFIKLSLNIILLSGALTWLFGRRGIHIGASALVMGYLGYLLVDAVLHPSVVTVILALICFYYFAGLLLSVFPASDRSSWEGHAFGLIAGLVTALYLA